MNNKKIQQPTLVTQRKVMYNINLDIINETLEFINNDLKLDDEYKVLLKSHIFEDENLSRILINNTYKNNRNKLVNYKNTSDNKK